MRLPSLTTAVHLGSAEDSQDALNSQLLYRTGILVSWECGKAEGTRSEAASHEVLATSKSDSSLRSSGTCSVRSQSLALAKLQPGVQYQVRHNEAHLHARSRGQAHSLIVALFRSVCGAWESKAGTASGARRVQSQCQGSGNRCRAWRTWLP